MNRFFTSLILSIAGLLACVSSLHAQSVATYLTAAGDNASLYRGRIEDPFPLHLWDTHPYWQQFEFHTGDICFDGLLYRQVSLRYDIYNNVVVVRTPVRGLHIIPDQRLISYFVIEGKQFMPVEGRFCQILYQNPLLALAHSRTKQRTGDVITDRRTLHSLFTTNSYYLLRSSAPGNPEVLPVKSLNSVVKAFPSRKQELRQFIHEHHLKSSKDSLEGSLERLVSYLGQDYSKNIAATSFTATTAHRYYLATAPDSIIPAPSVINLRAYQAYQAGQTPQYETNEEYAAPSIVADAQQVKEDHILDEITVRGFQQKVTAGQVGAEKFRPAQLRNLPLALGEADVMKMVQTLPGVKTMGEASSGFNVRGGASDQNLILLNGNTIFNPMHLFGVFSAFNSEVLGETELYKSGIPSQYGGRISSVMDIHNRIADRETWHGSASIGLLTSKATLEMPMMKGKSSLLLGGRTTYSDWLLGMIPEKSGYRNGKAGFWDASATFATLLNRNHRLHLYAYASHDRFSFSESNRYGYTNLNASAEWKGRYQNGMTSTVSLGTDHYDYYNEECEVAHNAARLTFAINQYFLRADLNMPLSENNQLKVGLHSQFYQNNPGEYAPLGQLSNIAHIQMNNDEALESTLFAEDSWQPTSHLKLTAGVRYTLFNALRPGKEHTYQAPEFRFATNYQLGDNQSVKFGFNTMHQFIHKVSNTSIMSPTDTWTLSNANIHPQEGWQAAVGYYWQSRNATYEIAFEGYYKQMDHYLTYRSAGQLLLNPDLEHDVIPTHGRAYGLELQLRKTVGRLNGWVSYSYSRTELQQHDAEQNILTAINGGDWFPAEYDRPHELKVVANYKFTERYSLSVNADYSTGRPTTIPAGQYYNQSQDRLLPYYTERNSYRLPDYFRMDASFNIEPSHHLTALTHSWFSIGCYNLLGRRNAYSIYYLAENGTIRGYQLSIFGAPIPFVSYNIKF